MAPESFLLLENSISEAQDRCDEGLYDLKFLTDKIENDWTGKLFIRMQNWCCIGRLIRWYLSYGVRLVYDVFQNYMVCSNHALELLEEMCEVDNEDILRVIDEARKNLEIVKEEIVNLRAGYPAIMKQVDIHHCEYYTLKQLINYYNDLGEKGQIEEKHVKIITEELDHKIEKLKLKTNFESIDHSDKVLQSQLGMVFSEEQALNSCKKHNNLLIKPAQIILADKKNNIKQLSVAQGIFANDDEHSSAMDITNKGVYLVAKGCVFEYLKSEFKPQTLDKHFTDNNKKLKKQLKKQDSLTMQDFNREKKR